VVLANRLVRDGARKVYVCASHGLFTGQASNLIDVSPIEKIVISDSLEMPNNISTKVVQISVSSLLSKIIESDGTRYYLEYADNEEDDLEIFEME
jgi:ribose-phosphate pyrophosphokinase